MDNGSNCLITGVVLSTQQEFWLGKGIIDDMFFRRTEDIRSVELSHLGHTLIILLISMCTCLFHVAFFKSLMHSCLYSFHQLSILL